MPYRVALLCGKPEPPNGLGGVLCHPLAVEVRDPKTSLAVGVSLLGGKPKPSYGFDPILFPTPAFGEHEPKTRLCVTVALLCLSQRFLVILLRTGWRRAEKDEQNRTDAQA